MKIFLTIATLLGFLHNSTAQFALKGKVTDQYGSALTGATISIENTSHGAIAGKNGEFEFKAMTEGNYTLTVSFVGFETQKSALVLDRNLTVDIAMKESVLFGDEVIVYATRANDETPTTFMNVGAAEIAALNLGQDIPVLLNYTPGMVTTSDAGAGIGYTGMRIRGSDATRINVTINGIPVNDSESHGVFWVNMPDLASSLNMIQVQRGVGTSSNGAAAFGATINMQTSGASQKPFAEINNTAGSFNTWKTNLIFNTGIINEKFNFEGRLSQITSDGYIDRASSSLKSYFLSGGYYGKKTTLKALAFGGLEKTYQAWYGTPEARLNNDQEGLQNVIAYSGEYNTQEQIDNLLNSDRRFNYYLYENEIDHYNQDHYQLHFNHVANEYLNVALSGHYTHGRGYFEQYRPDDDFSDYGLDDIVIGDSTITSSDFIRRRWLDNDFYGFTYAVNYDRDRLDVTLGGSYNQYEGTHYGEIIWAQYASNSTLGQHYYDGFGKKKDFNTYLKTSVLLGNATRLFGDVQVRAIDYRTWGTDNDLSSYDTGGNYLFVNPKLGISQTLNSGHYLYASYAVGNREPVRSDFIDAPQGQIPTHETLHNVEAGIKKAGENLTYEANMYYMGYKNQLVLTGALNDVGSPIRANVPQSYRLGLELAAAWQISRNLQWEPNIALSRNKIKEFTEVVYNYTEDGNVSPVEIAHENTDISFSPDIVLGSGLIFNSKGYTVQLLSKYVGSQYLDNTSNAERAIDSYFINDLNIRYRFRAFGLSTLELNLLINNIFNVMYESNGYTWGYQWEGELYQQNNYYPQAGTNFLAGISLRF